MECVKKQISLTKNLYRRVEKIAEEKQESFSDVVSKALDIYTRENKKLSARQNMIKLIGIVESGVSNGSTN
ncbi:MAG: hypothetical protein GW805_15750, partial [Ignavibacteria bacterium]|nr:hypothetical protein [Ignavibacteria bacterium]